MWFASGILVVVAIGAVVGLVVSGLRVDWDMQAVVGRDNSRGGGLSLGMLIPAMSLVALVCIAGAVAAGRQALLLTPGRH